MAKIIPTLCFVLAIGSIGGMETGQVGIARGIIQFMLFFALMIVSGAEIERRNNGRENI
jgi:hypothetical protein